MTFRSSKHTPGTWRTGRKVFRTVYAEDKLIGVMDRAEDATLAAAAPELLDACWEAHRLIGLGRKLTDEEATSGLRMLLAAVTKAERGLNFTEGKGP